MRNITKTLLGMDIFYDESTVTTVDLPLAAIMMFVARADIASPRC